MRQGTTSVVPHRAGGKAGRRSPMQIQADGVHCFQSPCHAEALFNIPLRAMERQRQSLAPF